MIIRGLPLPSKRLFSDLLRLIARCYYTCHANHFWWLSGHAVHPFISYTYSEALVGELCYGCFTRGAPPRQVNLPRINSFIKLHFTHAIPNCHLNYIHIILSFDVIASTCELYCDFCFLQTSVLLVLP